MGILMMIGTALLTVATAIVFGMLKDEASAWMPSLHRFIIKSATLHLAEIDRSRYLEEWTAHLLEYPGNLSKLYQASQIWRSSHGLSNQIRPRTYADADRFMNRAMLLNSFYGAAWYFRPAGGFYYSPIEFVYTLLGICSMACAYQLFKDRRIVLSELRKDLNILRRIP